MNCIGIDVSKGKSNGTLITDDFEKITFKFKHDKSGFKKLSKYISQAQDTIVIFETTGIYSNQLSRFLRKNKVNFYELNPYEVSARMKTLRRNKTDKSDSFKLALLGIFQLDSLNKREYSGENYEQLKAMTVYYKNLIDDRTRLINKLHALLEQSFPELNKILIPIKSVTSLQIIRLYAHPDFVSDANAAEITDKVYEKVGTHIQKSLIASYCYKVWLASKNSYPSLDADDISISFISDFCDEIERYNQKIKNTKTMLIKSASKLSEFKIMCSIPGIGKLSTAMFLGMVGDIRRFKSYKQLNAFIGIDINRYQSGIYAKKDKINRRGSGIARYVEFEMIRSMLRNQSRFNNHIVDYYYKLKEPPYQKHDLVALVACANHLNRTLMQLVRTNQLYDYKKASK